MREALAPLEGRRHRFRATVDCLGSRRDGVLTVCLREIADAATGLPLCDHAWVRWPCSTGRARLLPGEALTFVAVVRPYRRGGGGLDYQLTALRQVRPLANKAGG